MDSGSAPCTPKNQPTRPVEPTTETLRSDPSVVHSLAFPDSVHRSEDEANGTDPNCAQTPVVAEDRSTPDGLVAQTLGTVKRSALCKRTALGHLLSVENTSSLDVANQKRGYESVVLSRDGDQASPEIGSKRVKRMQTSTPVQGIQHAAMRFSEYSFC